MLHPSEGREGGALSLFRDTVAGGGQEAIWHLYLNILLTDYFLLDSKRRRVLFLQQINLVIYAMNENGFILLMTIIDLLTDYVWKTAPYNLS